MAKLNLTSNITFLYYSNIEEAHKFFTETLGLDVAYNPGWACVYKLRDRSYVGAVNIADGSIAIKQKGGVLISLTVSNIDEVYKQMQGAFGVSNLSPIKNVKDLALKSFFFNGPEGYDFEIEQFTSDDMMKIF